MQQGILAKLTLTSRYRSGHDPTRTKTSPRCAEGYHPMRTKYELVGEHIKKMSSARALCGWEVTRGRREWGLV
jgi:hypothetical protein